MKTEKEIQTQHQYNVERDTQFATPKEPEQDTDDYIIMSNNEYKPTTQASFDSEDSMEEQMSDEDRKEILEHQFYYSQKEYLAMIEMKVKNELISQLCAKDPSDDGQINFRKVADVIETQMLTEMNWNIETADYLESLIPDAKDRPNDDFSGKYTQNDIESLRIRVDSHRAMSRSILQGFPKDDESRLILADAYSGYLKEDVEKEANAIIMQRQYEVRIIELQTELNTLRAEMVRLQAEKNESDQENSTLKDEVQDRDLQLLDQELDAYVLTQQAKDLAKATNSKI